jgi:hypothetical protein
VNATTENTMNSTGIPANTCHMSLARNRWTWVWVISGNSVRNPGTPPS